MGLWSGASAWHLHTDLSVMEFFVPAGLLQFSEMSSSHESMAPALARSWEQRCHISSFHFVHPRCCPLSVLSHTSFTVHHVDWRTAAIPEQRGAADC